MRFLRPRIIGPINNEFNSISLILYFFSIITTLIIILVFISVFISVFRKEEEKEKKDLPKITKKLYEKFNKLKEYIQKKLEYLHNEITAQIPNYTEFMDYLMFIWLNYHPYHRIITNLGIYLPLFIVALSYFIDVVINKNFYFFPMLVILSLLPFLLKLFIWIPKYKCEIFCSGVEEIVIKDEYGEIFIKEQGIIDSPKRAELILQNLSYYFDKYDNYKFAQKYLNKYSFKYFEQIIIFFITTLLWFISSITMVIYLIQKL